MQLITKNKAISTSWRSTRTMAFALNVGGGGGDVGGGDGDDAFVVLLLLLLLLASLWPSADPSAGGSRVWAAGAGKCNSLGLLSCNAQVWLLLLLLLLLT